MLELMLLIALYYFIKSLQAVLKADDAPEPEFWPARHDDENVVDINEARRKRANGRYR